MLDPDPDPYQMNTDPKPWRKGRIPVGGIVGGAFREGGHVVVRRLCIRAVNREHN